MKNSSAQQIDKVGTELDEIAKRAMNPIVWGVEVIYAENYNLDVEAMLKDIGCENITTETIIIL